MNYKTTILLAAAMGMATTAWAEDSAYNDSINITNPKSVKVIEKDGKVTIEINGQKDNDDYLYSRTIEPSGESVVNEENRRFGFQIPFVDRDRNDKNVVKHRNDKNVVKRRRSYFSARLNLGGFGFALPLNAPDALNFKTSHTMEWNLDHLINVVYYPQGRRRTHFMLGFGMQWRTYGISNMRWTRDDAGLIAYSPWDEGLHKTKSFIDSYSLTIPFMIIQPLGSEVKLSAGVKACFNLNASVHNSFTIGDIDYTEHFGNIHHRRVTPEICGALTWEGIGVYVNYTPCNFFKSGKGPDLKCVTIGFAIAY